MRIFNTIRTKLITSVAIIIVLLNGCNLANDNSVVLVTPAPLTEIEKQVDAFNEIYPEIRVETMYLGVGEIITRLKAESANPQIDVASDLPISYMIQNPDLFQSYKSEDDEAYSSNRKDNENYRWYGHYMGPQVIIVNTNLIPDAREKIHGWNDLDDPEYKDEVILANPSLSSSAFDQLRLMVTIGGWDLVAGVLENSVITPSSRLAYQGVADGEYAIGMLTENIAVNLVNEGYPVTFIYPEEGTNETLSGLAMIENGPNSENAKKLFEFLNSRESHQIAASEPFFRRSARTDVELHPEMLPTSEITFAVSLSEIMAFTPDMHESMLEEFDVLMADMD